MTKNVSNPTFAVCISNEGCDDVEVGKLYRVLPDDAAAREQFLRVVDESGKDYLYPAGRFMAVELAPAVVKQLMAVSAPHGA
jgi:hypothetical protein